jgi:hemerythrin
MSLPDASISCEVGAPVVGGGFVPLTLGDSMLMGIPDLDDEHRRLVALANAILSPEDAFVPAQLLVRFREFFSLFEQHMQHELAHFAKLGIADLAAVQEQHESAIKSYELFLETCEGVDQKFPWTPQSLRQIFQCFLIHALDADLRAIARWKSEAMAAR